MSFSPGDYVRCVNPLAADWFPLMEGAIYLVCSSSIQDEKLRDSAYYNPVGSIRLRAYPAPCSESCFEPFDYRAGDWYWLPQSGEMFWLKSQLGDFMHWECVGESRGEFLINVSGCYPVFGRAPHIPGESDIARKLRMARYERELVEKYDLKNVKGGW